MINMQDKKDVLEPGLQVAIDLLKARAEELMESTPLGGSLNLLYDPSAMMAAASYLTDKFKELQE